MPSLFYRQKMLLDDADDGKRREYRERRVEVDEVRPRSHAVRVGVSKIKHGIAARVFEFEQRRFAFGGRRSAVYRSATCTKYNGLKPKQRVHTMKLEGIAG